MWRVRSYRSLIRIKRMIYRFGDIRLIKAVSPDQILIGFATAAFLMLLYAIMPFLKYLPLSKIVVVLGGSIGSAFGLTRLDLEGKNAFGFGVSIIQWATRPHRIVRWKPTWRRFAHVTVTRRVMPAKIWHVDGSAQRGWAHGAVAADGDRVVTVVWDRAAIFRARFSPTQSHTWVRLVPWTRPKETRVGSKTRGLSLLLRTMDQHRWEEGQE